MNELNKLRGWLLQVLTKPRDTKYRQTIDKVFSFGGGGSGFSNEQWDIVRALFGFEYMGAAEYEFGAPRKALEAFSDWSKDKLLESGSFVIPARIIALDKWDRESLLRDTFKEPPRPGDTTIFAIYYKGDGPEVERIVRAVASDEHRTKEWHRGNKVFDPLSEEEAQYIGWLSVDQNRPFIAVKDEDVFRNTKRVFGI